MKKIIAFCASALFLAAFIFISPLRSAALDVMSIFRVSQANTIRIAITDIQELMTNVIDFTGMSFDKVNETASVGIIGGADGPTEVVDYHVYETDEADIESMMTEAGIETLSSLDDFTAFDFKLPKSVSETPKLAAKHADKTEFALDVDEINKMLEKANASRFLPESYDGAIVTIDTPPAIAAQYENFIVGATQMPVLSAQDGIDLNVVKDCVLSSSLLPSNLVSQLAMIDVYTRDVYLPVITGISREVNINGSIGYVYSASDFGMVMDALSMPQMGETMDKMVSSMTDEISTAEITAIVWVKDGSVYVILGEMPESELLSIARSVK